MKKKLLTFTTLFLLIISILNINIDKKSNKKIIKYNGNNLMVTVNDKSIDELPSNGNYYLTNYECDNANASILWDRKNYKLSVTNGKNGGSVSCSLTFKSNPLLNEMPQGSYVDYTGTGGKVGESNVKCKLNGEKSSSESANATESSNSCIGENAHEDLDNTNYTYGYCFNSNDKYYTTGWRIAYTKDEKVKLVSAGAPECITRESSYSNLNFIRQANANALKYCNKDLVDGDCTCESTIDGICNSQSNDAWAISDTDFYFMTNEMSGYGKRLTENSSTLGVDGGSVGTDLFCYGNYSHLECGYNNDLLDNGGLYWFASQFSFGGNEGIYWSSGNRGITEEEGEYAYGLRPIINLSSTVYVIDGDGTMNSPYKIANKKIMNNN